MKYKLTKAEQETVINFDNELDTASIYTHDSRLIKKLRELRKQYPEQFILEHREHGSVTYTIPKRCVCLLYTSPSPRDRTRSRMPSSA